ncbi:MAG: TrkH family potassium uptake protein [Proteobacteria bacterium]|nr:TrkH family potassium uptake protein [Pseudomonadota bacterium]MBU4011538.1 TrkH family potassium uptake protein [Pseudomonadota bacterium]
MSFISVILIGSFLLSRPFASTGPALNFVDSLFTSTSATCVTGLIVVDTGSSFSTAGQIIILMLIQVGGLGIMSFSTLLLFFFHGRFGIGSREVIQETLAFFDTIDIGSLLKSVFIFTFSFEAIGTVLLTIRFLFDMPFDKALYAAVFHSISAFCNAGFSTFPDSLTAYRSDIFVNLIIMFLIISGGIGFIVIYELYKNRKKGFSFHKLSLHSRAVLLFSGLLIIVGTVFLFIFEYDVSMKGYSLLAKILSSMFQSVTARTAGFNTIDISAVSMPSLLVIANLMFIGASPASCGGGIKTATLAVIFAFIRSKINDTKNVNLFYSTLPFKVISKAIVLVVFAILTVILFSFLVTIAEFHNTPFSDNGTKFIQIFFEVVSAFGTVGLSAGITAALSPVSRILITIVMLIGRVGPLTLAVVIATKDGNDIKYAEDNILVG